MPANDGCQQISAFAPAICCGAVIPTSASGKFICAGVSMTPRHMVAESEPDSAAMYLKFQILRSSALLSVALRSTLKQEQGLALPHSISILTCRGYRCCPSHSLVLRSKGTFWLSLHTAAKGCLNNAVLSKDAGTLLTFRKRRLCASEAEPLSARSVSLLNHR